MRIEPTTNFAISRNAIRFGQNLDKNLEKITSVAAEVIGQAWIAHQRQQFINPVSAPSVSIKNSSSGRAVIQIIHTPEPHKPNTRVVIGTIPTTTSQINALTERGQGGNGVRKSLITAATTIFENWQNPVEKGKKKKV